MTAPVRSNYRTMPRLVADMIDFDGSNCSGRRVHPGTHHSAGTMPPGPERDLFFTTDDIAYIVWSWATPIAWYSLTKGWHKSRQHYSQTTSRQQGCLYLIEEGAKAPCDGLPLSETTCVDRAGHM